MSMKLDKMIKLSVFMTLMTGFLGPVLFNEKVGHIHIFLYRIIFLILLFFSVVKLIIERPPFDLSRIKVKAYLGFLILWFFYGLVSLSWSISKADAIRNIMFLFMAVMVICMVVYYFSSIGGLEMIYYLWLFTLVLFIFIGLWEVETGYHLMTSLYSKKSLILHHIKRPTAVFYNPNDFATYLVMSIPFLFTLVRYKKNSIMRFLGMVCVLLAFFLLIKGRARSAFIAIGLEFLFVLLVLTSWSMKKKVIVLIGAFTMILIAWEVSNDFHWSNDIIRLVKSFYFNSHPGKSFNIRLNLLKNALVFLKTTCGIGVGAGNTEYWMKHFSVYPTWRMTNLHNWWFEILTNYGLLVFCGYVVFFIGLLKNLFQVYKNLDEVTEKMICEALMIGLVGFVIACVGSSSIMTLRFQWFFFAFSLAFLNYTRLKGNPRV